MRAACSCDGVNVPQVCAWHTGRPPSMAVAPTSAASAKIARLLTMLLASTPGTPVRALPIRLKLRCYWCCVEDAQQHADCAGRFRRDPCPEGGAGNPVPGGVMFNRLT